MGVVLRGRAPDGRPVAIKVLPCLDGMARARFAREARLLAELTAEGGFVPLLDHGKTEAGEPFVVMPLLAGGTLRTRLERGVLGVDETIELGRELARALARAHARGIVHRDVKPENVLFDDAGRPFLSDLGIAKHFAHGPEASAALTKSGALVGTAGYMAPEQCSDAKTAGAAADVFALAAVLWECLAGRPAFEASSLVE